MKKHLITALQVIVVVGFVGLGVANIVKTNHKVKLQDIQLKSKQSDLIQLENKFDLLNKELEKKNLDAEKAKQLETEKIELQKQLEQAQKDLQAKTDRIQAEKEKIASATSKLAITPKAYAASNHTDLMTQAGIPLNQQSAAEILVQRESSWNVNAYNSIGACSLVQALPCSKIQGNWRDPIVALKWGHSYVTSRYGTWQNALAHSYANNWY